MSDQRANRRDDHEQLDLYLGVALAELKHYAESPDAAISDLERALSALRRALVYAARIAYRLADSPNGAGDSAVMRWAHDRVANQNRESAIKGTIDELILISSKYSLRSGINESPYDHNQLSSLSPLTPLRPDARNN